MSTLLCSGCFENGNVFIRNKRGVEPTTELKLLHMPLYCFDYHMQECNLHCLLEVMIMNDCKNADDGNSYLIKAFNTRTDG
jgi:hypothetical protein